MTASLCRAPSVAGSTKRMPCPRCPTPEPAPGSYRAETPKRPSDAPPVLILLENIVREDLRSVDRCAAFACASSIREFCLEKSQTCPGRDAPPRARPRHLPLSGEARRRGTTCALQLVSTRI